MGREGEPVNTRIVTTRSVCSFHGTCISTRAVSAVSTAPASVPAQCLQYPEHLHQYPRSVYSTHGTCISTRVTLLLLECDGEEGATHAAEEGDQGHLHQLHLQEGEGATPVQIIDDLVPSTICTAATHLHAVTAAAAILLCFCANKRYLCKKKKKKKKKSTRVDTTA